MSVSGEECTMALKFYLSRLARALGKAEESHEGGCHFRDHANEVVDRWLQWSQAEHPQDQELREQVRSFHASFLLAADEVQKQG